MAETPTLSLVIPCYNERDNLRALIAAIREAVVNATFIAFYFQ